MCECDNTDTAEVTLACIGGQLMFTLNERKNKMAEGVSEISLILLMPPRPVMITSSCSILIIETHTSRLKV